MFGAFCFGQAFFAEGISDPAPIAIALPPAGRGGRPDIPPPRSREEPLARDGRVDMLTQRAADEADERDESIAGTFDNDIGGPWNNSLSQTRQ